MSDATTARPHAIASSSTMPKLSLPDAGETKMSPVAYQRARSALGTWPRKRTCSCSVAGTDRSNWGRRYESPTTRSRARPPVRSTTSGIASSSSWTPLRGSSRPTNSRLTRPGWRHASKGATAGVKRSTSTPFGMTWYSPGK